MGDGAAEREVGEGAAEREVGDGAAEREDRRRGGGWVAEGCRPGEEGRPGEEQAVREVLLPDRAKGAAEARPLQPPQPAFKLRAVGVGEGGCLLGLPPRAALGLAGEEMALTSLELAGEASGEPGEAKLLRALSQPGSPRPPALRGCWCGCWCGWGGARWWSSRWSASRRGTTAAVEAARPPPTPPTPAGIVLTKGEEGEPPAWSS